jgi:hypothetical protein
LGVAGAACPNSELAVNANEKTKRGTNPDMRRNVILGPRTTAGGSERARTSWDWGAAERRGSIESDRR